MKVRHRTLNYTNVQVCDTGCSSNPLVLALDKHHPSRYHGLQIFSLSLSFLSPDEAPAAEAGRLPPLAVILVGVQAKPPLTLQTWIAVQNVVEPPALDRSVPGLHGFQIGR